MGAVSRSGMASAGVLVAVIVSGCAGGRPHPPPNRGGDRAHQEGALKEGAGEIKKKLEEAARRLTVPFRVERVVLADHLVFEASANFDAVVARPAGAEHRQQDGHVEYRWTNKAGIQAPLRFRVGATDFLAIRTARLRVSQRGKLGFSVIAHGRVVVEDPGGMKHLEEFRVADGVVSGR